MKITRFLDRDNNVRLGSLTDSGAVHPITGDIFGSHTVSAEIVAPRKLLAPLPVTPPAWGSNEQPARAPSDATVLFDGTSLAQWKADGKKPAKADAPADDAPLSMRITPSGVSIKPKLAFIPTFS